MKFVYVSKKVEICIQALKKNGKEGAALASKAKCIIENLALGTVNNESRDSDSCDDQPVDFSEDENLINLNEQDMRIVFCGLIEGAKKRSR